MPSRTRSLPSLTALASFEAAARLVSFKAASSELNVTPAAISHQVKALEAELGVLLFHRNHRGVELTEAGAVLFVAIQRAFQDMSDAIGQARLRSDTEVVTIEASSAVSSLWLTPSLTRFWSTHGFVAVSQNVNDTPTLNRSSDLKIFYGDPSSERGEIDFLFRDKISVLASPDFAERYKVHSHADLAHAPLIHLTADEHRWTGWQSFLAELGYNGDLGPALYVNNYAIALQSAQDGNGAVLGWEYLARKLVSSGSLVRLFPTSIPAPYNFHISKRPNAHAKASLLRDWLLKEAASGR